MRRDDLIASFCRGRPARVAQATELWLGFEQGQNQNLPVLRRLLHTIKGEAHMLELQQCSELAEAAESLVDALREIGAPTQLAGDALLGAFEGIGMVTSMRPDEEPPDLSSVYEQIHAATDQLKGAPPTAETRPSRRPHPSKEIAPEAVPSGVATATVEADEVRPLVHEMRRLYGEQAVFHERLRETQRMLRALLAEIDPRRSTENLAERITKTLGYGAEIERRLSSIRTEWSGNDFSMGLALDELDSAVRRASVVSTDRLLSQVVRVGRSTARTLNKDVELRVRGDAILDAAVEQRLEPALLHLVRNAMDHGIESASVRSARGKADRGLIEVTISQTESSVTAEIADDGGGINFDRLRTVLASRVPNVQALANEDLLPFLFEQGVTTAEQVSTISGRGVGLDVVAREVATAGGQIRIESNLGIGTRVVLNLPTTLRGELAVPVLSGKQRYAIPSRAVYSVVRIEHIEQTAEGLWLRVPRDGSASLVRLYSLAALLRGGEAPKIREAAVILYHASGLYAVSVEGYDNPRPITVQPATELAFRSPLIRGVAPTPDGGVLLLLDVDALHAAARGVTASGLTHVGDARKEFRALVVEDAPVARELLCGILRSLGLRVEEATDGRQGLMLARANPPDVVLTDIEMPYMDGIEMIAQFRASSQLAEIPIVVLTTAANEHNRARLEGLGVMAVLSKRKFVESELQELIDRCLQARA
jgi:two-component system, chemotaxis family, sensor kinase CheA